MQFQLRLAASAKGPGGRKGADPQQDPSEVMESPQRCCSSCSEPDTTAPTWQARVSTAGCCSCSCPPSQHTFLCYQRLQPQHGPTGLKAWREQSETFLDGLGESRSRVFCRGNEQNKSLKVFKESRSSYSSQLLLHKTPARALHLHVPRILCKRETHEKRDTGEGNCSPFLLQQRALATHTCGEVCRLDGGTGIFLHPL